MSEQLDRWMAAYRTAWDSNLDADIRVLFTDDAVYRPEPYGDDDRAGIDDIVAGWIDDADEASGYTFEWSALVDTAVFAVITGETAYVDGPTYSNLWVIHFAADGRATDFTEWWMDQTPAAT